MCNRVITGHAPVRCNYATDRELLQEIAEEIMEGVGDICYGSTVIDPIRHQITCKLEDGRKLRLTCVFE